MRKLCLNQQQSIRLIDIEINNKIVYDDDRDLISIIELWKEYEMELYILSMTLSHILEKDTKNGKLNREIFSQIDRLSTENGYLINIETMNVEFIKYLMNSTRDDSFTIEENIINIVNGFINHEY